MKHTKKVIWLMISVFTMSSILLMAQGPMVNTDKSMPGMRRLAYLQLDEQQQEQVKSMFTEMQKQLTPLKAELKVKTAKEPR